MTPTNLYHTNLRFERKFTCSLDQRITADLIASHPARFSSHFPDRQVHSLYLDTQDFDYFYQSVNGHSNRQKVRLRWYQTGTKITKTNLEIKQKSGLLGTKHTFLLGKLQPTLGFSTKSLTKADLPGFIKNQLHFLTPTLYTVYTRSYFISANHRFRLTLDTQISHSKPHSISSQADPSQSIIELKYQSRHDSAASHITQHFPFRVAQNSKYTTGINLIYS